MLLAAKSGPKYITVEVINTADTRGFDISSLLIMSVSHSIFAPCVCLAEIKCQLLYSFLANFVNSRPCPLLG